MSEKELEIMKKKDFQSNSNVLSNPYDRYNNNYPLSEARKSGTNILKNIGKELIINPNKKGLSNKNSHKSIFIPNSNSSRKKRIYDPYLIKVCKHAIIKEKKELPHFKEIIRKINTEFGIEETKKELYEMDIEDKKFPRKNFLTVNTEIDNKK